MRCTTLLACSILFVADGVDADSSRFHKSSGEVALQKTRVKLAQQQFEEAHKIFLPVQAAFNSATHNFDLLLAYELQNAKKFVTAKSELETKWSIFLSGPINTISLNDFAVAKMVFESTWGTLLSGFSKKADYYSVQKDFESSQEKTTYDRKKQRLDSQVRKLAELVDAAKTSSY